MSLKFVQTVLLMVGLSPYNCFKQNLKQAAKKVKITYLGTKMFTSIARNREKQTYQNLTHSGVTMYLCSAEWSYSAYQTLIAIIIFHKHQIIREKTLIRKCGRVFTKFLP